MYIQEVALEMMEHYCGDSLSANIQILYVRFTGNQMRPMDLPTPDSEVIALQDTTCTRRSCKPTQLHWYYCLYIYIKLNCPWGTIPCLHVHLADLTIPDSEDKVPYVLLQTNPAMQEQYCMHFCIKLVRGVLYHACTPCRSLTSKHMYTTH